MQHHLLEPTRYGEFETFYVGCVHAPGVESFPRGYGGTYIVACYPDGNWLVRDEPNWSRRPRLDRPVRGWAVRETGMLAKGLSHRR